MMDRAPVDSMETDGKAAAATTAGTDETCSCNSASHGKEFDSEATLGRGGHRWFAAMYDVITMLGEHASLRHYRKRVAGAATGRVLEIGAGTGANLPYYSTAESIVATDPDRYMLQRAQRRANRLGLSIEFHLCPAEKLPFPDESFDTVVVTLALCTVDDPGRALQEVRRVLKSGGSLRFIEHVQADGGFYRGLQTVLAPLWHWLGAGCHLDRRTADAMESAGFEVTELQHRSVPLTPLIIGEAIPKN